MRGQIQIGRASGSVQVLQVQASGSGKTGIGVARSACSISPSILVELGYYGDGDTQFCHVLLASAGELTEKS